MASCEWAQAAAWIEQTLGGKVENVRSQGRWRTAWFFDLVRGNERLPLYFRGHRPGLGKDSRRLKLEMAVLQVLAQHRIPVPQVYGLCPEPEGIVMAGVPGRHGLASLPDPADRQTVLDQYIDALVAMHRIDPAAFAHTGLPCPMTSEARGLADLALWEKAYRKQKQQPEPLIECVLRWLKAHVPPDRHRTVCLQVDAGQFMFDGAQLTALLDFELAMLGDPMADLAGLRTRHLSEPLGDLAHAYRRYEAASGEPIDWYALDYHTVRFALMTPLPIAALVARPPLRVNLPQYLGWYYLYSRIAIEMIAHLEGVTLDEPDLPAPDALPPGDFANGYQALCAHLEALHAQAADPDQAYELDITARTARYLQRAAVLGPGFEAANRAELATVLGQPVADWPAAWAALEQMVVGEAPPALPALLRFFYRYVQRHLHVLGPGLRELEGARLELGKEKMGQV